MAASLNFSLFKCVPLPSPANAKLILPGLALASAMKPLTDFSLELGLTLSTLGIATRAEMSTKSFCTL
ncbi:hypothetical protein D3C83_10520 [compost metagenome]